MKHVFSSFIGATASLASPARRRRWSSLPRAAFRSPSRPAIRPTGAKCSSATTFFANSHSVTLQCATGLWSNAVEYVTGINTQIQDYSLSDNDLHFRDGEEATFIIDKGAIKFFKAKIE